MVHRYQRRSLVDRQYHIAVEYMAGQDLGALRAAWNRGRLRGLVLVRPAFLTNARRRLVLRPCGNRLTVNYFICLRVRSGHKNFLIKERGT